MRVLTRTRCFRRGSCSMCRAGPARARRSAEARTQRGRDLSSQNCPLPPSLGYAVIFPKFEAQNQNLRIKIWVKKIKILVYPKVLRES